MPFRLVHAFRFREMGRIGVVSRRKSRSARGPSAAASALVYIAESINNFDNVTNLSVSTTGITMILETVSHLHDKD